MQTNSSTYFAAAANKFFAFGAPGSAANDLAASNNLLEAVDVFLRLLTTWSWASLSCNKTHDEHSFEIDLTLIELAIE